ncbi:MAG: hypothetical protein QNJ97_08445 [Myxococcota bacterium]|nr:hypothetical protein [Myxococcota bacterium]
MTEILHKLSILTSSILLLTATPSKADLFEESLEGDSSSESEKLSNKWNIDSNGFVKPSLFVGKKDGENRAELKSAYAELGLKLRTSIECVSGFADIRLKTRLLGDPSFLGQPTEAATEQYKKGLSAETKLTEAYVSVYLSTLEIRAGKQILVWGRADGLNPTDNLTPIDMRIRSSERDDQRLGNAAIKLTFEQELVRVEGIWLPIFLPSYLPPVTLPKIIVITNPRFPALNLENGLFAGRFHLLLPSFEASISYLKGHAPQTGIALRSFDLLGRPPNITVQLAAYDHHVVGFDFSTALGDLLGFRGEVAYRYPANYEEELSAPNPDLYYVVGVDRAFGEVNVIAQYVGRYVLDWKALDPVFDIDLNELDSMLVDLGNLPPEKVEAMVTTKLISTNRLLHSQTEQVQHGASLRIEWNTLHDTLSLAVFGLTYFTTREWLLNPEVVYKIADGVAFSVGGEIYRGPKDTLFDLLETEYSAGYAELRVGF